MNRGEADTAASPVRFLAGLAYSGAALAALGGLIIIVYVHLSLRLTPLQFYQFFAASIFMMPAFFAFFAAGAYLAFRPIYHFLGGLQQGEVPDPARSIEVQSALFRFPRQGALISASLWLFGSPLVGLWVVHSAELMFKDMIIVVATGSFLGVLTSLFFFLDARRRLKPIHRLLDPYLPADHGYPPSLLPIRWKLMFSILFLAMTLLAGASVEVFFFSRYAMRRAGINEAVKQTGGLSRNVSYQPMEAFGFSLRKFSVDSEGRPLAGQLSRAEMEWLKRSRHFLGAESYYRGHPLRSAVVNAIGRVTGEPDHLSANINGRDVMFTVRPDGEGNWKGAVVERITYSDSTGPGIGRAPSFLSSPVFLLALFLTICAVFIVILSFLIADDLHTPLRNLQEATRRVREGDLGARVPVETDDELGELMAAFNEMSAGLNEKVMETRALLELISGAIPRMSGSSSQIVTIASEQASGATEQAASIQQVSTTSEQMAAILRMISENAHQVKKLAGATLDACREGDDRIKSVTGGMDEIRGRVHQIAERMLVLKEEVRRIEDILDLIRDISEKTNIIALNASIEASGAGEAGQRFSIIAGEVRSLAEQAMKATEDVHKMVTTLEEASNQALMVTEEGSKRVETTHVLVGNLSQSFEKITRTAERTSESVEEIAMSSEQQTRAGEHLAKVLADINQVAKGFVDSAREIEKATLSINQLSKSLEEASKGGAENDQGKEAGNDQ